MVRADLMDVSLKEFLLFIEVSKTQSIREAARRARVEPSQISRAIQRLEKKLGLRLIQRTASGIVLTEQGTSALQIINGILERGRALTELSDLGAQSHRRDFGIGATSFMTARLLAKIAAKTFDSAEKGIRLRLIDVAPDQLIACALKGAYDLSVHAGTQDWPASWEVVQVGELSWNLYARSDIDLASREAEVRIQKIPFVWPVYWTAEGLTEGDDQCPLPQRLRLRGNATASAEAALAVVRESHQLAFLPEILARESVQSGRLRRIDVIEWPRVTKSVYLSVRKEVVPAQLQKRLSMEIAKSLGASGDLELNRFESNLSHVDAKQRPAKCREIAGV